ncbi:glutathione S-transferase family protein [Zwartia sp.]|uniref:glutathione S-transferase family protein n=1 Tax=Zwartia sp. TaxID=2978004 RepID=UPI002724D472|nr:glutathione S-transferase family protein [Zwartia sp.]MDO9024219.1 glutathione S-transferase family protein [Zwartia sp.]
MILKMYDLAGAQSDRRFSPYCWRIRLALAHKGLDVETIPWRFSEKGVLEPSGQGRVPVLVHNDNWLCESWVIANYLEEQFPDRPSLFGGPKGKALSYLYSTLGDYHASQIVRMVLMDIYDHIAEQDKPYFRQSREQRFGMTLEEVVQNREELLPIFRDSLFPLRAVLKSQPFFGGDAPLYADYALFGQFQWARCISDFELLAVDDPIVHWRSRMLNAFDGLAATAPAY